jgi:multiple sugar transport system ATP-binding protein
MIAGLEETTAGEIRIGGRAVTSTPPRDRDVAMVFQNYALYPHMTVAENMGFSLRMRKERRDVIDRKVHEAAVILGLDRYLDRLPRQLSGGQRQRVAMGRAIVRAPKVFLFDEPLSNLDAQLRVQMRAEIKDLHQRLGTTTIYVTHDQVEAMTLADRIVVLRDGRVEQSGAPLDVYDTPVNVFVAGFIGSPGMNMLRGRVGEAAGQRVVRLGPDVVLPIASSLAVANGTDVVIGVRPEHVQVGAVGIAAQVIVVEQTGAETHLVLRLGDARLLAVSRERQHFAAGAMVHVSASPTALHLFDPETGRRVG